LLLFADAQQDFVFPLQQHAFPWQQEQWHRHAVLSAATLPRPMLSEHRQFKATWPVGLIQPDNERPPTAASGTIAQITAR
jgi:hypothetical protein